MSSSKYTKDYNSVSNDVLTLHPYPWDGYSVDTKFSNKNCKYKNNEKKRISYVLASMIDVIFPESDLCF